MLWALVVAVTTPPGPAIAQPGLLGGEFLVNTYTANRQTFPAIAIRDDGQFVVVWHAGSNRDGNAYGVFARRFGASGIAQSGEFQVNTYTSASQSYPRVAITDAGGFVVVWNSFVGQDGDGGGIFGRRFDSTGAGLAVEFQVNTYSTGGQSRPDVGMEDNGDFIVAWAGPGVPGSGVFGQRFDSGGARLGEEFSINTVFSFDPGHPSVAVDSDGDFVVAWDNGSNNGIFAQRFDQTGTMQGAQFNVNSIGISLVNYPRVTIEGGGDFFFVVWNGFDGGSTGIKGQRFDSSGTKLGLEFLVNTYSTASQSQGAIGMAGDGTFVVAWQSTNQDGPDGTGIFAQVFDSTGAPSGIEFQVNRYTPTGQDRAAAAMDDSGNFVIAWRSARPAEANGDVMSQRGGEPPALVPADIDGNGATSPLTDGVLVLRYLFHFTGSTLISGAVGPGRLHALRCAEHHRGCSTRSIPLRSMSTATERPVRSPTGCGACSALPFRFPPATRWSSARSTSAVACCDAAMIIQYLDGLL